MISAVVQAQKFVDKPILSSEVDSLCRISRINVIVINVEKACLKATKDKAAKEYWAAKISEEEGIESDLVFRIDYLVRMLNPDMRGCSWLWVDLKRKFVRSDGKF
jgi:hypothetical protein